MRIINVLFTVNFFDLRMLFFPVIRRRDSKVKASTVPVDKDP